MGKNFYLWTSDKNACNEYFSPHEYSVTDMPALGYQIHIAKTSMGWLPLFEAHRGMESVKDLEAIFKTGNFKIYDEDGRRYCWDEFTERVLKHNGGVQGAIPLTPDETDTRSMFYDKNMPAHTPVSHFEYANGRYADEYFKDSDGYEFTYGEFS